MPSARSDGGTAPTYSVPLKGIVSIEHPCIIANVSNGFKSLGGEQQLKHVLEHRPGDGSLRNGVEPVAGVSLRPSDPFAKKLSSTAFKTQNVLLKVTLPKRTGRKRKWGTDDPFADDAELEYPRTSFTASDLLERLRDNPETYMMQAVGTIQDTHRFQTLPDFQVRADDVPVIRKIREHAVSLDYDKLKDFHLDLEKGWKDIKAFPAPPSFVPSGPIYRYEYKPESDGPRPALRGARWREKSLKMLELGTSLESGETAPTQPPPGIENESKAILAAVEALTSLLDEHPIISTRAVHEVLQSHGRQCISNALPYVGYYVNRGPWNGTIVKYGIDPRTHPKFRFYQTVTFRFPSIRKINSILKDQDHTGKAHLFDSTNLTEVSKFWQLRHFVDPLLQDLVNTSDIREQCDETRFGWFANATIAKLRTLVREKIAEIVNGASELSDDDYKILAALPNWIGSESDYLLNASDKPRVVDFIQRIIREVHKGPKKWDLVMKDPTTGAYMLPGRKRGGNVGDDEDLIEESLEWSEGLDPEAMDLESNDELQDEDGETEQTLV